MDRYVLNFDEIDQTQIAAVGGKGANLGELSRIDGVHVPAGFCVTTDAYRRFIAESNVLDELLTRLSHLTISDEAAIRTLSAEIREELEGIAIPNDLERAMLDSLAQHGAGAAYAVRSSATAEDLPTASFAGQQDSYLNVIGEADILRRIRECWASLFSGRAVTYRVRNDIDHRQIAMAVVIQRMVVPDVSGILFTADPMTGNRKVTSVEASFGLGEALVSGQVNPDVYKVRDGEIVSRSVSAKHLAIVARPSEGTRVVAIEPWRQTTPALTDAQIVRLAALGGRIEAHSGQPQDIEWCLTDDDFQIVQTRPITTLFPIPVADDEQNHVYISVGHQQMMTDATRPLGISIRQLTAGPPMPEAGGRLWVDATRILASPKRNADLLAIIGKSEPLIGDALQSILDRGDFIPTLPDDGPITPPSGDPPEPIATDPALVVELIQRNEASVAALKRDIESKSGQELFDFLLTDFKELKRLLFEPLNHQAIMAGMDAAWWLNEHIEAWLGEKNVADVLTQSVPGNITSEMGLELLDVADAIRPYPDVVSFLEQVEDENFMELLPSIPGGEEARRAMLAWLERHGMRCVGEIDITRPRWSERPIMLVPLILSNVRSFEPGERVRRFEQGRQEAMNKEASLLEQLRSLPDGVQRAAETKRMIDRVRTFAGYREYPKYGMISRYFVYKQALLQEAERLVEKDIIQAKEDVFYLTMPEFAETVRTSRADEKLIRRRRDAFRHFETLTPPRVLTSDGECISGSYHRGILPQGALIGLPVSPGIVEGRARVVRDMAEADFDDDDILVTAFTDPSWTPVFVSVKGLVTEIGGTMTHGAVIAREYGLPAVVGVERATQLIRDGQQIRVNATDGYVELLS